ncbi:hypothetical protein BPAE_0229g00150 [Botrytis paeoniae]|uniref:Uncharacterized protein n=1 Tax=Botrytis paeoniae TaxID=278948 RepID=A0A4Z1F948_9HELO|nr:hypothetical protein BPAE_0229g00150 [Botrytis paeoniae]
MSPPLKLTLLLEEYANNCRSNHTSIAKGRDSFGLEMDLEIDRVVVGLVYSPSAFESARELECGWV